MTSLLKGNFKVEKNISDKEQKSEDLESKFEREALKHLGGSMAFVKKKQVDWDTKI